MAEAGRRSRIVVALALVASALVSAAGGRALADPIEPGFAETTVISGLEAPTSVQFSPDGRVFVAEKRGVVLVFDSLADPTPTVFADLRTQVHNYWDRGLLGMALDPDFPATPYVYVLYTRDAEIGGVAPRWGQPDVSADPCPTPPGPITDGCVVSGRLSRLEADGDVMIGPEHVLVDDWCQQFPSHSVGTLTFGPDGALYVSAGDGASFIEADYGQFGDPLNPCGDPPAGVGGVMMPPSAQGGALRAQDLVSTNDPMGLDGTILRLDPATGDAMPDNPLAASHDPNTRRVIAHGVRNPFRITFRPGTDELWVGDVGWDTWEELDLVEHPADAVVENFGWPCFEGDEHNGGYAQEGLRICDNLYDRPGAVTAPVFTYNHDEKVVPGEPCGLAAGSAMAGLAFYDGGTYPEEYDGALFLADYNRHCVWVMFPGPDGRPDPATVRTFDHPQGGPVDLRIGPGGDLYSVDYDQGAIHRYQFASDNHAPTAVMGVSRTNGPAPLSVDFDATGSSDVDGDPITFAWDLDGDGAFDDATDAQPTYVYTQPGTVTARLRITDIHGASSTSSVDITATNTAPQATVTKPTPSAHWSAGERIPFAGRAADRQEPALPDAAFHWTLALDGHRIQRFDGVRAGSFDAPDVPQATTLTLTLTVTDAGGLSGADSVDLTPTTANLRLTSNIAGIRLTVNSTTKQVPREVTVVDRSTQTVAAPSPQRIGGTTYVFTGWSDGGQQTHTLRVERPGLELRATYAPQSASAGPVQVRS